MEFLNQLSPPELLFLRRKNATSFENLIKAIFLDLLRRDVLELSIKEVRKNRNDKARKITYVRPGDNYFDWFPLDYEWPFWKPFQKEKPVRYVLGTFFEVSGRVLQSKSQIYRLIARDEKLKGDYFYESPFHLYFGWVRFTDVGVQMREQLKAALPQLEADLKQSLEENDAVRTQEILALVKGNVYLFESMDSKLAKRIDLAIDPYIIGNSFYDEVMLQRDAERRRLANYLYRGPYYRNRHYDDFDLYDLYEMRNRMKRGF